MIDTDLLHSLQRIVGESHVASNSTDLEVYFYDAFLSTRTPGAVVFPHNTEETATVIRAAGSARVPYVPRGLGTNLSGGSNAPEGGLAILLRRRGHISITETFGLTRPKGHCHLS